MLKFKRDDMFSIKTLLLFIIFHNISITAIAQTSVITPEANIVKITISSNDKKAPAPRKTEFLYRGALPVELTK